MKYIITKTDGSPVDPLAVYYVLRLDRDTDIGAIARGVVIAYAKATLLHDQDASLSAVDALKKATNIMDARKITNALHKMAFPDSAESLPA